MNIPDWRRVPIISGRGAQRLLQATPGSLCISLDLGLTEAVVCVKSDRVVLPDGQRIARPELTHCFTSPEDCVILRAGHPEKLYLYDEAARTSYKLYQPFENRAPTIILNDASMHSIVRKDPWQDAADKVAALPRAAGHCLDTCCCLGYSAQLLSRKGFDRVTTCEVDANVLDFAAVNPWSEGLFSGEGIQVLNEDVRQFAAAQPDNGFQSIFHDPPTVYHAGELYSAELYGLFARILAPGGSMYHYVGTPGGRKGQDYPGGVMRRLQAAGFTGVRRVTGGVLGALPR